MEDRDRRTMAPAQGSSSPKKRVVLKDVIVKVLKEAGKEGLHSKEQVKLIKQKKLWVWKDEKKGCQAVTNVCAQDCDTFVRLARGFYALKSLQKGAVPLGESLTLKDAIALVLEKAGPKGLQVKDIVQEVKKKKLCPLWVDEKKAYQSISAICSKYRDIFARVSPGIYALGALQDETFKPYEKPKITLGQVVNIVLKEAGPRGLPVPEIVQRSKKAKLWDWDLESNGRISVYSLCRSSPKVFVKHANGFYALVALQDAGRPEPDVKSMPLKEAITIVLKEAGPKGLIAQEIVSKIKKKELCDLGDDEKGFALVSGICQKNSPGVFVKHGPDIYALKSLQEGEGKGSPKALAKEKARDVKRTPSVAKRKIEAAIGSAVGSTQRKTMIKKKKKPVEIFMDDIWMECNKSQSDTVPSAKDRGQLLLTDAQIETMDKCFQRIAHDII